MAKVTCECGPCNHEVEKSEAIEKDGKYYCSEACASGKCTDEHGHSCDCGHCE